MRAVVACRRLLRRWVLPALVLATLAAPAAALAEDLGPSPVRCVPAKAGDGCYAAKPGELSDTWLGEFSIEPKVVRAGEYITATATPLRDRVTWRWDWPGCAANAPTCRFKVGAQGTHGWVTTNFYFSSPYGTGVEGDYYAVIAEEYSISGHVRDATGLGVGGVTVNVAGKGGKPVRTNQNGFYHAEVPKGRFTVSAGGYCVVGAGGCAGSKAVTTPGSKVVDFAPAKPVKLSGTIRAVNCDIEAGACHPPVPLAGVTVAAAAIGGGPSGSAVTLDDGTYVMEVPAGTYRLTPTLGEGTLFTPASRRVAADRDSGGLDFQACASATSEKGHFDPCSGLEVAVKATPSPVLIAQNADGPVPRDVIIAVTVTNKGPEPAVNVTLNEELSIGYDERPRIEQLPLRHKGKPARKRIGTLRPGQKATRQYVYTARGDARLTIDALVSSGPPRDTRWTTGYGRLELKSPLLYASTSFPKANRVRSPDSASLIKAGTNFAIRVKLENRSFTKTLLVQPHGFSVRGNAHGGKWQSAGLPIQPALAGVPDVAQCTCHEVIRLPPNTEQELDVVFGSWANDSRARKVPKGNRGTRADLRLLDFDVWVDLDDGTGLPEEQHRVEAVDPKDAIIDAKTRSHRLSFDDASAAKPPFDGAAAAVYFTAGAFQGAWDWTAGTVRGVFVDLPTMIGNGVLGLPTAAQKYVQLEVELWESIKDDPAAKLAYFNALQNQYLLAYKNAPALKQKAEEAWGGINSSVEQKYTAMFNEWYDGDWTVAATQFGNEGAQRFLDVASALAPCVLARFPRAVEAMRAARAATYEQITTSLASLSTRLRGSEAARALATVTRLGYEYSPALLKQLYGFTDAQISDLRRIAEEYKVLITVRSRSYDALRWGEDVFFKPEPFKTKTVNWIDVEFLDYGDDIGRLVIKRPISRAKLLKNLEVAGVEPGSARYREVLLRYDQRVGEWNSKAFGMPQDLLGRTNRANRAGSMELEFNWSDNLIDPSLAPQQRSTIGVQLERSKRFRNGKEVAIADEWVVKVDYDGTGVYRSVVGDMDIVAITDLAGGPLADARHIEVIRALQGSSLKSPHMESGSWVKNGKFWFPAKEREFVRPNPLSGEAAIDAQFAPGSSVRAVAFNKKRSIVQGPLIGQDNNRLIFDGSLVHVGAE